MDSVKPWVKALGVPPAQFEQWRSAAPEKNFLTFWCLEQGHLPLSKYLEWAKEEYGLAVLSDSYIQQPVAAEFWKQVKAISNWSKEFLPICEWDGTIFVACTEPREDINWSFPVQYVLASPKFLNEYWQKLNSEMAVPVAPMPVIETEEVLQDEPILDDAPEESAEFSEDEEPVELLDGLNLDVPDIKFDFSNLKTSTTSAPPEPEPVPMSVTEPEPEPEVVEPQPVILQSEIETKTQDDAGIFVDKHTGTSTKVSTGSGVDGLLKDRFIGGMLLVYKNEALEATEWTSHFKPKEQVGVTDLNAPSAFRIVHKTHKPYLGHIVETDVNKHFFNSWGFDKLPEFVLIQPVISQGHPVAMFICLCDKNIKLNAHIHNGQTMADDYLLSIKNSDGNVA